MLPVLLSLAGCFTAHNSQVTSEYARQVSTASLRVAQLEQEVVSSRERIEQLEEVIRLQGQSEAARLDNLDQVNDEIARLRGALEVAQFEIEGLKSTNEEVQLDQERRQLHDEARLRQIEALLGVKPPPPPSLDGASSAEGEGAEGVAAEGEGAPEDEVIELPEDAVGRLEVAVGHMEAGRQAVARVILQRILDENEGAEVMDEVRYRFAETYVNEEKWRDAILEFRAVIDNHPASDWACWAYYRQGEAMEELQGAQQAAPFYKGATTGSCKNSEAGKLAKKKL